MKKSIAEKGNMLFALPLLLIMLVNPSVRLIDLLPDFIPCFIIAKKLFYYVDRAPYFAEARSFFIKLGWLSIARIPAFAAAATIKAANVADNDITVLFTFIFAVGETFLLLCAVKNLFAAVFYLGMRDSEDIIIVPFALSKGKRTLRPEALKAMIYAFVVFKAAASALPEMLLLSRTDEIGVATQMFNFRALYPYFVVVLVPLVMIVGIIIALHSSAYFKKICKGGYLRSLADQLITEGAHAELEKKALAKSYCNVINLILAAAILAVDIRIENLSMIDLIPDFLPAVILFVAVFKMTKESKLELVSLISLCTYGIISVISYFVSFNFLNRYGYALIENNPAVAESYMSVILCSAFELAAFIISVCATGYAILLFLGRTVGIGNIDSEAVITSKKRRKEAIIRILIYVFLSVASGVTKFLFTLFNYYTASTLVATDMGLGNVTAGLVPWFGTLVFAIWAALSIYTYFFVGYIKEEINLKYS